MRDFTRNILTARGELGADGSLLQEFSARWAQSYRKVIDELPVTAGAAGLTMCGMITVIDARIDMMDVIALAEPRDAPIRAFFSLLRQRAVKGIGGEIKVDWPDGPAWLKSYLPVSYDLGGTGPHAARVLSALHAKALVALQDRSAQMLSLFPPDVLIAEGDRMVSAQEAKRHGAPVAETFIFEFAAGSEIDGSRLARSSRIIVRFADRGIDIDPDFDALTPAIARNASAGLVSGLNNEPLDKLDAAIDRVFGLTRSWRHAGLPLVHLELAGYASREAVDRVLEAVPGSVTSVGMSHSELLALTDDNSGIVAAMTELGERLDVERICVHADHWAATATKGDPYREQIALVTGCLVAATRAAAGVPLWPSQLASGAAFHDAMVLPEMSRAGKWALVSCPSPYLARPVTTLGLGDSFTAGCLLALGRPAPETGRQPSFQSRLGEAACSKVQTAHGKY